VFSEREQLVVRAALDQGAVVQYGDPVDEADGREPVGDEERRRQSSRVVEQQPDQALLGGGVQIGRGFVENHESGSGVQPEQRPRHAETLQPLIERALETAELSWDDVVRICVGVGPGGFTGLRLGVATARALAQARLAARRLEEQRRQSAHWQRQAEEAVRAGDDARARAALRGKRESDRMVLALEEQAAAAEEGSRGLQRQLEAMQSRLAESGLRAGVLRARQQAAEARRRQVLPSMHTAAFEKYRRIHEKMDRVEAEAEALRELGPGAGWVPPAEAGGAPEDPLDDDLAELERKLRGGEGAGRE
jgi:phage shock protein A